MDSVKSLDRAAGSLYGLAIGDALGMPTQMLSRRRIGELWGRIDRFHGAPDENPISRGTPAGRVTDDTDQAAIVARLLVDGDGHLDPHEFARQLITWHDRMRAQGSLDLLGPSTLRALDAVRSGTPVTESGRWGDTNGAAMRVASAGLACAPDPLDALVDLVAEIDLVTHNTGIANAGAAAVAAAVSAGVQGQPLQQALALGVRAAGLGATRGHWTPGPDIAARIEWACDLVEGLDADAALDAIDHLVGTSVATQESVPAAFALVHAFGADPWQTVCAAASLGGDCDTMAAMAGAIVGAYHGLSAWPDAVRAELDAANPDLKLHRLAADLLSLRPFDSQARSGTGEQARSGTGEQARSGNAPTTSAERGTSRSLNARPTSAERGTSRSLNARPTPAERGTSRSLNARPTRLVLIGSVIADLMMSLPALPERGGDMLAGAIRTQAGGGFNVLAAASRLGLPVALAGLVGAGPMGAQVATELAELPAELLLRRPDTGDTGVCMGFVEPDGERTFVTSVGVEAHLTAAALDAVAWQPGDATYVSGYDLCYPDSGPAIAAHLARRPPELLVVDPGPLVGEIPPGILDAVLSHTHVFTLNARELDILIPDAKPDADQSPLLGRLAPGGVLIVRAGASGAWLHRAGEPARHSPAPAVVAVDTTGAGDAHTGALVAELVAGTPLPEAVARATVAAAIAVSRSGSATGPTRAELDAQLRAGSAS